MGILDRLFKPKPEPMLFSLKPSDAKMSSRARGPGPSCNCFTAEWKSNPGFHSEMQDTNCDAWKMLNDLIDTAAAGNAEEFSPGLEMPPELWSQIITLPPSISKLKSVRKLYIYGSYLVRIPPEIGEMENLEQLDPYTSYRLHWLPYEVTRCRNLKRSRFSTRTLYGNYKFRHPFPQLHPGAPSPNALSINCSVCGKTLSPESTIQAWISLRVATDVLPLLLNACSNECIRQLPPPAFGYVDHPHSGGPQLSQPPRTYIPPRPDNWMPRPDTQLQ